MLKFAKIKYLFSLIAVSFFLPACNAIESQQVLHTEPKEQTTINADFSKFINKVIISSKTPSTIVYEYQDVRVDEVALLAAVYCQDNGNRNAYLEKIILYKNNKRRASFYCSSK